MMPRLLCVLLFAAGCSHSTATGVAPAHAQPDSPPSFTTHVTGAGRPVIFIADVGAPGQVWDTTVAHLAGRVQSHVLDVAGFAGNPAVTGPLLPRLKSDLAAYIKTNNLQKPVVVGHMLGASVGWWLAMTEPALLGGVVAVDAPPSRTDGSDEEKAEATEMRNMLLNATPEQFSAMQARRLGSMMKDADRAQALALQVSKSNQAVVAEVTHDILTRDLRAGIASIQCPVLLFLTSENFPKQAFPEIAAAFEKELTPVVHHQLVVVEGSRHYVMFDAPEVFFGKLDAFLDGRPAG